MKLKFDKNLEYQQQAIASVVDLFRGQTPMHTNFTVSAIVNIKVIHWPSKTDPLALV
jgi:restriction endonuclease